jgi:hypothetical protein
VRGSDGLGWILPSGQALWLQHVIREVVLSNANADTLQPIAALRQADSAYSSLREKVIEHIFIGELLRWLWEKGVYDIEILRPEVDNGGYDLLLECDDVIRHVQLKSMHREGRAAHVNVSQKLVKKPSGCVIWMQFDRAGTQPTQYLWFGGKPGERLPPLGEKLARHTKANINGIKSERSAHRQVARSRFQRLEGIEQLATALFGSRLGRSAGLPTPDDLG